MFLLQIKDQDDPINCGVGQVLISLIVLAAHKGEMNKICGAAIHPYFVSCLLSNN